MQNIIGRVIDFQNNVYQIDTTHRNTLQISDAKFQV